MRSPLTTFQVRHRGQRCELGELMPEILRGEGQHRLGPLQETGNRPPTPLKTSPAFFVPPLSLQMRASGMVTRGRDVLIGFSSWNQHPMVSAPSLLKHKLQPFCRTCYHPSLARVKKKFALCPRSCWQPAEWRTSLRPKSAYISPPCMYTSARFDMSSRDHEIVGCHNTL